MLGSNPSAASEAGMAGAVFHRPTQLSLKRKHTGYSGIKALNPQGLGVGPHFNK